MRGIFVRKEGRTRAHVFIIMLAYLLAFELRRLWRDQEVTVEEGLRDLAELCATEVIVGGASAQTFACFAPLRESAFLVRPEESASKETKNRSRADGSRAQGRRAGTRARSCAQRPLIYVPRGHRLRHGTPTEPTCAPARLCMLCPRAGVVQYPLPHSGRRPSTVPPPPGRRAFPARFARGLVQGPRSSEHRRWSHGELSRERPPRGRSRI